MIFIRPRQYLSQQATHAMPDRRRWLAQQSPEAAMSTREFRQDCIVANRWYVGMYTYFLMKQAPLPDCRPRADEMAGGSSGTPPMAALRRNRIDFVSYE